MIYILAFRKIVYEVALSAPQIGNVMVMNVALITAFIAIMLVPMGTAWIIALGAAPVRIALRQLAAALTVELVALVAIHVGFYSTFTRVDAFGYIVMYLFTLGINGMAVTAAVEYIGKYHDELEPPTAPKLIRFRPSRNLR